MPSLLDVILRRNVEEPEIPECPDHHVEMRLRGKLGRPSRFEGTSEQTYTQIYFCPVVGCNNTEQRVVARRQIPVPGLPPKRPEYSRIGEIEKRAIRGAIEDHQRQLPGDSDRALGPGR